MTKRVRLADFLNAIEKSPRLLQGTHRLIASTMAKVLYMVPLDIINAR